jgi:hypothetical protein
MTVLKVPSDKPRRSLLALAEQVAFLDRDIANDAGGRRIAGTEGDFAGTLLHDLDFEVGLVRRRAGRRRDVDLLEEAEIAEALLAAADLGGAERIALGQTEFPPDDLVERTGVARDVDALDIDARPFLDIEVTSTVLLSLLRRMFGRTSTKA